MKAVKFKRNDFLDFLATCTGNWYATNHICTAIPNKQPRIWHPLLAAPRRPPRTGRPTAPPAPQGQPLQANNATRDAQACFCPSSADLHDRPLLEDARTARLRANSNLSQLGSHIELKATPRSQHFTAKDPTKLNGTYLREEIWEFSITSSYIQFHVAF